ncbi:MAG: hypothetical protein ACLP50_15895 [Solirubrobacteraceae bacterium]
MSSRLSRAGLRTTRLGAAIALAALALAAAASPSWAARRIPTYTAVSTSALTISASQSATIAARIWPAFLVGPNASVRFTDATNDVVLGIEHLGERCLFSLQPCVATVAVPGSSLAPGPNEIVGAYSGDRVEAPSSGTVVVYQGVETECGSDGNCDVSATSPDGSAAVGISTPPPPGGTEQVAISFSTQPLPCSTPGTGDTLAFTVTGASGQKTIDYDLFGAAAQAAEAANPSGYLCFGSPTVFTTASGFPATLASDGLYYGPLPFCDGTGVGSSGLGAPAPPVPPCLMGGPQYTPSGTSPAEYAQTFITTAADPRAGN